VSCPNRFKTFNAFSYSPRAAISKALVILNESPIAAIILLNTFDVILRTTAAAEGLHDVAECIKRMPKYERHWSGALPATTLNSTR